MMICQGRSADLNVRPLTSRIAAVPSRIEVRLLGTSRTCRQLGDSFGHPVRNDASDRPIMRSCRLVPSYP